MRKVRPGVYGIAERPTAMNQQGSQRFVPGDKRGPDFGFHRQIHGIQRLRFAGPLAGKAGTVARDRRMRGGRSVRSRR